MKNFSLHLYVTNVFIIYDFYCLAVENMSLHINGWLSSQAKNYRITCKT